jgi:Spy/CpxP family protein refolding chaperone
MGMQRGGGRGFGGGAGLLRMAENPRVRQALNLTDDQVARLRTISVDAEKASVQTRADMQLRHIELRELMRADNPNQSAIMAKLDEVNALQGKMGKQRVQTMLSARSVLTPDQIKKIKTFMENRGAGGGERGGMMERRGGMGRPQGHPGGGAGMSTPKPQTPPPTQ